MTKSLKVNGKKKNSGIDRFAFGKIKLRKAYHQGKFINKIPPHTHTCRIKHTAVNES